MADVNTLVLLHLNTDLTDSSPTPHTVTAVGNAAISTLQKKFGAGSLLLDGTGDGIKITHNADLNFGTGNFTLEGQLRWSNKTGEQVLAVKIQASSDRWILYKTTDDKISFSATVGGVAKANYITTSALTLSNDTWYHFALVRNGTTMILFLDGVSQALTENTAVGTNNFGDNTGDLYFGIWSDETTDPYAGNMDEIRISNVARWTTNFTPPTNEYDFVAPVTGGAFADYLEV